MSRGALAGRATLAAMLLAATYVMWADFFNLRHSIQLTSPATPDALPWPQPWGGMAWLELATLASRSGPESPAIARRMLQQRVRNYPITPRPWLDLARLESRRATTGSARAADVAALLRKAQATRPRDRDALWSAAQIALQTGDSALAERQLRSWLREFPADTGRALFIGARWIAAPGELLDRMLPPGREYLAQAMSVARRHQDRALGDAVWTHLSPPSDANDPVFLDYIELLMNDGDSGRATKLWMRHDLSLGQLGVTNGSFDRPLGAPLGLNWRIAHAPASVRIERDPDEYVSAPASLRIAFNGKENIVLTAPSMRLPAIPGQHYRLAGMWRATGLTTRALPYVLVTDAGGAQLARLEVPANDFVWREWSVRFESSENTTGIEFAIRRDRTNAFDRNIDGQLWLDDLRLEAVDPPAPAPSIPDLLRGATGG